MRNIAPDTDNAPSSSAATTVALRLAKRPKPTNSMASQNTSTTRKGHEIAPRACSEEEARVAEHAKELHRAGLHEPLRVVRRLDRGDALEQQRGGTLRFHGRIDRSLDAAGLRRAIDFRLDDGVKKRSRFARVGPEAVERAVELEQMDGDLLHLRLLRLVGAVRRRDEKSEHQRRDGRDEAHHELDDVLRLGLAVMRGQASMQVEARKSAAERRGEHGDGDDDRAHSAAATIRAIAWSGSGLRGGARSIARLPGRRRAKGRRGPASERRCIRTTSSRRIVAVSPVPIAPGGSNRDHARHSSIGRGLPPKGSCARRRE